MNPLISVVVPVYKVEPYLDRCVKSLISQTYENLEIILVDDGSPDSCGRMCDDWAQKDARIKVVHQKNGGLSAARNAGAAVATGAYVGFIDSDDYVAPDMYRRMYAAIEASGAMMCVCGVRWVNEDGSLFEGMERSVIRDEVLTKEDIFPKLRQPCGAYYTTAWNKLYEKSLVENVKFPVGRVHEDEFTVHLFLDQCNQIACVKEELYFYVQRAGSIMNSNISIRKLDAVRAMWDRYVFYRKKGYKEEALRTLEKGCWLCDWIMNCLPVRKHFKELLPWVLRLSLYLFPRKISLQLVMKLIRRLRSGTESLEKR